MEITIEYSFTVQQGEFSQKNMVGIPIEYNYMLYYAVMIVLLNVIIILLDQMVNPFTENPPLPLFNHASIFYCYYLNILLFLLDDFG